jgi:hypothetical protein
MKKGPLFSSSYCLGVDPCPGCGHGGSQPPRASSGVRVAAGENRRGLSGRRSHKQAQPGAGAPASACVAHLVADHEEGNRRRKKNMTVTYQILGLLNFFPKPKTIFIIYISFLLASIFFSVSEPWQSGGCWIWFYLHLGTMTSSDPPNIFSTSKYFKMIYLAITCVTYILCISSLALVVVGAIS